MTADTNKATNKYTCNEYREEMILASLQKQLHNKDLSPEERKRIQTEVARLEKAMGL